MKVYIVEGCCGEYEDYYSWPVAAYLDKELAKEHVRLATNFYLSLRQRYSDSEISRHALEAAFKNPYDPNMSMSYTGPEYQYYPVEVLEKLPDVNESAPV